MFARVFHVVAQVVETEFVVGAVGDVGGIGGAARIVVEIGDDDADVHAEELVDPAHPFGVARRQIVVDGDDMDAFALEGVEIDGERRHQRLALAGAHLGDLAAMEDDPADHLDVVVTLTERPLRRFANRRERLGEEVVERLPCGQPGAERRRLRRQRVVGHRRDRRFVTVDAGDERAERADIALVRRAKNALRDASKHENPNRKRGPARARAATGGT